MSVYPQSISSAQAASRRRAKISPLLAGFLMMFAGAAALTSTTASSAPQSLRAMTSAPAEDVGPASTSDVVSFSVVLKLRNADALAQFVDDVTNPSSSSYHQFLSPAQFTALYAPTAADVAKVVQSLNAAGISVTDVSSNRTVIRAQGTVGALNSYFATDIHNFASASQVFTAPAKTPTIPSAVSGGIAAAIGLSTQHVYHSNLVHTPEPVVAVAGTTEAMPGVVSPNAPGQYTTNDVANFYQMQPLYAKGFNGAGRTIGIVTLANFNPADAYAYWSTVGLNVNPNRITQVHVDNGGGSDGADETTLDVEQSGGLAPAANIIVYDAPNTDQSFYDAFSQAVNDNLADTVSVSWGEAEILEDPDFVLALDPLLAQAAAQGISFFAASGDSGAYDLNGEIADCDNVLTVDYPAASPFITAAGGLTLPGLQTDHKFSTPVVKVPTVRAWGWDYLANYYNTNYASLGGYLALAFPNGGGGGVSVNEALPKYQASTPGIQKSAKHQSVICDLGGGFEDLLDLPGNQAGRNLPDLSLNADPYTGYILYFQGAAAAGWGGTSFVAPQLNGMTSVISQAMGSRLGLINAALYRIAKNLPPPSVFVVQPFNDTVSGDNLFYNAVTHYDPATGLGSINAYSLFHALQADKGK
jgi:kumamolisin